MRLLLGLLMLATACATSPATRAPEPGPGGAAGAEAEASEQAGAPTQSGGDAGAGAGSGSEGGAGASAASEGDGGVASQSPPRLLASVPALGDQDVYPAPLWSGNGEEVVIELVFSEPMRLDGELELEASDHTRSIASVEWSHENTQLQLFARPDFSFPHPLADETEYRLDLSALVNESGAGLDPDSGLEGGALRFRTGRLDALLNHSCGHTFFGPYGNVVSTTTRELAPDIGTTHIQYTVTLPEAAEAGSYAGWVRARFLNPGSYRLYFDAELPLQLSSSEGPSREVLLTSTPAACPGITHQLTLDGTVGEDQYLFLGPASSSDRRVIVELVAD